MKSLSTDWLEAEAWERSGPASSLLLRWRRLLTSRDSLTDELENIFGKEVGVELKRTGLERIGREVSEYLGVDPSEEALVREVWLTVDNKRVVYARSVFPVSCTDARLLDILASSNEPLGKILLSEGIRFGKDMLEIGLVEGEDLGLDGGRPLLARRYRLFKVDDSGGCTVNAAVTEVFGTAVIPAESFRAVD